MSGDADAQNSPPSFSREYSSKAAVGEAGERRNLTVMFCDLAGSTALSHKMDEEQFREMMQDYYGIAEHVIDSYGGYVGQYLGDGILAYFGYPVAQEDAVERALRCALDIVSDVNQAKSLPAVRIGVHTGPTVVGEIQGLQRRETLAHGETLNIAARLQGIAPLGSVVVSQKTLRFVRGIFLTRDLGLHEAKGLPEQIPVHQIVQPTGVRSRFDFGQGTLTPLVGRESEIAILLDRWGRTCHGEGQVTLITGEPGVGKSRLVQEFRHQIGDSPHTWLECGCSPHTSTSSFFPITELLRQGLAFHDRDSDADKLKKLENGLRLARLDPDTVLPLMAPLLSISNGGTHETPELQAEVWMENTIDMLVEWCVTLSTMQPAVLLFEDLQWCDASTLKVLHLLVEKSASSHLLIACTARPEFHSPWRAYSHLTPVKLIHISEVQANEMIHGMLPGNTFPEELVSAIIGRGGGIPLYIEELVHLALDSGLIDQEAGSYVLRGSVEDLAIPATLQDSLMGRLDRLSSAKQVAQSASVLGREFSYVMLEATAGLAEPVLRAGLRQMVEAELLYQRGTPPNACFTFRHMLIQETAYQSLLTRNRKVLHARIANALETRFQHAPEARPEVIAQHYEFAGMVKEAIERYEQAGRELVDRPAHEEGYANLKAALRLLMTCPESTERNEQELALQLLIGHTCVAVRGWAHGESQSTFERALVLCENSGTPTQKALAMGGLIIAYADRGAYKKGIHYAQQLRILGEESNDPFPKFLGNTFLAEPAFFQGNYRIALDCANTAAEIRTRGVELEVSNALIPYALVTGEIYASLSLWALGYPEQALTRSVSAMQIAERTGDLFARCYAIVLTASLHYLRREIDLQERLAKQTIALDKRCEFPLWQGVGQVFHGSAIALLDKNPDALEEIQTGLTQVGETGNQSGVPIMLGMLAEVYMAYHLYDRSAEMLELALHLADETEQRFWDGELLRLKGELALMKDSEDKIAEEYFQKSLDKTRGQHAKSLELRASVSLARYWDRRGQKENARNLLRPILDWFTEGLDTPDIVAARELHRTLCA